MHEVCRPLEVPPTRAHVSRTGGGGAALAAPKKKCTGEGALSGSGHGCFAPRGHTPAHVFRRGGSTN